MKRLLAYVAVAAVLVVGVKVMMEATQNRPDDPPPGSSSSIEFRVSAADFQRGDEAAATALWAVCAATVDGTTSALPEPVGSGFRVSVTPALGEHGTKRLVGCLEDLTLDRMTGEVLTIQTNRR
jgi:hypothetical protein